MAIRRLGLTPFHRRSFLALQRTLAGDQLGLFDDPELLTDELTDERSPSLVPVMDQRLTGDPSETPAHLVEAVR